MTISVRVWDRGQARPGTVARDESIAMFYPSIRTPMGTMRADDAVRALAAMPGPDAADMHADAAGSLAWWAAYLRHAHECVPGCGFDCNVHVNDIADDARADAIARVYARRAGN